MIKFPERDWETPMNMFRCMLALSCVVIAGCGESINENLTAENFGKITGDMTPDDIRELFGSPDKVEQIPDRRLSPEEGWRYKSGKIEILVCFADGRVSRAIEFGLDVGDKHFTR